MLLWLFVLCNAGYYFVYLALTHKNENAWKSKVVLGDFRTENIQSRSIPISFPYLADQKEYQTVDERVKLEGKVYRIIKKRYANDTLHIMYINDYAREKIESGFTKWVSRMLKNNSSSDTKTVQFTFNFPDQQYFRSDFTFRALSSSTNNCDRQDHYSAYFKDIYPNIPSPPPKVISIS